MQEETEIKIGGNGFLSVNVYVCFASASVHLRSLWQEPHAPLQLLMR